MTQQGKNVMKIRTTALYAHLLTSPERRDMLQAFETLMESVWQVQNQNLAQGDVDCHVAHLEHIMGQASDLSRELNRLIGDARTAKFRALHIHEEG